MAFSLLLSEIADAISGISISGVTVRDRDQIAADMTPLPYVLYPKPDGWITGFKIDYMTVTRGSNAPQDVTYTLNYRLLGVQVGDIATFPASYSALVDKLILVVNAIDAVTEPYSGRVEMTIGGVEIGPRADPAGNNFFGADFALRIKEMQN